MDRRPNIALIPCSINDDIVIFISIAEFATGLRDKIYRKSPHNSDVFWEFRENGFYMRGHVITCEKEYLFSLSLPKSYWYMTNFAIFAVNDKTGEEYSLDIDDIRNQICNKYVILDNMRERFLQYRSSDDSLLSWGGAHIKNISVTLYIRIKSFLE